MSLSPQPSIDQAIAQLSIPERILLVERIWDGIAAEQEKVELSPELCEELDRRMAEYEANPDEGLTWEEVKARLGINKP